MKKIYNSIQENRSNLENFEIPQHTQKIDAPYFASLETTQLS